MAENSKTALQSSRDSSPVDLTSKEIRERVVEQLAIELDQKTIDGKQVINPYIGGLIAAYLIAEEFFSRL